MFESHLIQIPLAVNSRDTGSMSTTSDTSPPLKFSAAEESSPENRPSPMLTPHRLRNGQSTESLDSLSDESHGGRHHNRSSGGGGRNRSHHNTPAGSGVGTHNPVARPRRVRNTKSFQFVKAKKVVIMKCLDRIHDQNSMKNLPGLDRVLVLYSLSGYEGLVQ